MIRSWGCFMHSFRLIIFFIIFFAACGGTEDEPDDDDAGDSGAGGSAVTSTLSSIQTNILTPTCAVSGCHAGGSPSAGLDLSAENSFSNLASVTSSQQSNKLRVKPSDPDNSYLVNKIEGTGSGSQMPRGGSPLSSTEIQAIRDWIANGANNN